ncbi:DUF4249 domain-containing protein [Pedobacter duraquae]|uniref:Uncharacterized protein DUF4249 n=1 Tax=Pedobacter duraquae TaxID=425511 RepID=A0A4R6IM95_9SPHI|nr:DUF4249 domain-containing protein [Pedobacter duraquae]TDO23263.1 uncharacterized protein DUF4249 [Pedobacter duraquae]
MNKQRYFGFLIGLFVLASIVSCEKVLDLNLNNASPQLVIEGNLTDVRGVQSVKISKSVPFDQSNVFPAVSGASVVLTDNVGNRYNLLEGTTKGTYNINNLFGRTGRVYTLNVGVEGQTFTAVSTMPPSVRLDSLTGSEETFGNEKRKVIAVNFSEPGGQVNYYLFRMSVNGKLASRIFTDNDLFTNGKYVRRNLYLTDNDNVKIESRDEVLIDFQTIDKPIYTYWFSLEQQSSSGNPNDVTTPANPPSNFNNGVLGYFSAHTTQTQVAVLK